MANDFCTVIGTDPAVLFAEGGYSVFMDLAPKTFNQAVESAGQLADMVIEPIQFTASFDYNSQLTPFQRPARPVIDGNAFNVNLPAPPPDAPTFQPREVGAAPAPTLDIDDPNLVFAPRPDTPIVDIPQRPPTPLDLTIPTAPNYVLPELPTFIDLNLPSPPSIQMPRFEGERPVLDLPPINENWSWSLQQYVSQLLDETKAKVRQMMDGETGLESVENVLFERGRARIEVEQRRAIDTRIDEFATRGFSEPNGILSLAVDEIIQSGLNQKGELNREITLGKYREMVENVRFAVQQGIALEQVAVNLHVQEQQLALQAAQFQRETAIALLNVRVSVFNALLQGYQADASVFQTRIQAELARIELFRAQIEGEKVRGEINEQRARLYAEQVRGLNAMAEFYRSQVQAVQAQADVERAKIDRYKADVDAYSARWRAYGEEVGGYKASIDAENAKAQVHRNFVDAFATRTQAWGTQEGNKVALERLRIDQSGQTLAAWRAQIEKMQALLSVEGERIRAQATRAGALAQIYTADASIETAASAATDRSFQLGMERERAEVDTQLKAAEMRIQENIALTAQIVEIRKSLSQVLSQLAASAMSAMNFSASVSSSRSRSISCDTRFSWSGEVADYN